MEELDIIENRISLLKTSIEFEEIINAYLSEEYVDEELETMDKLSFRKNKAFELQYRFANIYNLDILQPENGYSILNINSSEEHNVKKFLHRFLSYKGITGGTNAGIDGSDELFEDISANAVKNF